MDQFMKIHFCATSAMFGVIWIVQLVHYPLFAGVDGPSFDKWHAFHANRITYVVAPLMVAELVLSSLLVWKTPNIASLALFGLTIGVWAATFLRSVPLHNVLGVNSKDRDLLIKKLVQTNWIRTILYTLKLSLFLSVVTVST